MSIVDVVVGNDDDDAYGLMFRLNYGKSNEPIDGKIENRNPISCTPADVAPPATAPGIALVVANCSVDDKTIRVT